MKEAIDLEEATELEEEKRMKYDKVIKKLKDGEWDTSMDVKKRMHLTYTDNNTGKKKVVFVEELEEGKFDKLAKKLGRINPETLGNVLDGKIKLNPAEKKEFDEFMKGVRKMFASESADLEEAIKWWTVTITKKAGKLFKGQTVDVKASNSAQAIKKGLKQMKADPMTVPSGSVDAVLGESSK